MLENIKFALYIHHLWSIYLSIYPYLYYPSIYVYIYIYHKALSSINIYLIINLIIQLFVIYQSINLSLGVGVLQDPVAYLVSIYFSSINQSICRYWCTTTRPLGSYAAYYPPFSPWSPPRWRCSGTPTPPSQGKDDISIISYLPLSHKINMQWNSHTTLSTRH